jgi:hypothetical protein
MMAVVMRPFSGPDGMLETNQLVDATGWKNFPLLLSQNYIRVATEQDVASATEITADEPVKPKPARLTMNKLKHRKPRT